MFVACGIWCLADVSSVSPSSEQTHDRAYDSRLVIGVPHLVGPLSKSSNPTRVHRMIVKYVLNKNVFNLFLKVLMPVQLCSSLGTGTAE